MPRVELSLIYSINAASQIYIGAGKLEQAEKSVNRLRTLVSAGALKQTPPKVVYYTAMSDLSQACILATSDLPQSEKLFKKCIDMLDQQGGAGNNESERALYDYVKCLKRVKVPQRAEFYNSKLDAPLSLNAS